MASPIFDSRHIKEYLLYGFIAAAAYMIPVVIFLYNHSYQHLYYLFMGCAFFLAAIFYYVYTLLYTRYDEKRAVSMLIAGHLATITGIILACVFVLLAMLVFNGHLFSDTSAKPILANAAPQNPSNSSGYLLMMILATAIFGNFATGSFISIIVSYAGKRNQTKDKPVDITGPQTVERK